MNRFRYKDRKREWDEKYRVIHAEQLSLSRRKYYLANREKALAQCRVYRETHREQRLQYSIEYYKHHREEKALYDKNYRLKHVCYRYNGLSHITLTMLQELIQIQHGMCSICGGSLEKNYNLDHDHHTGIIRSVLCPRCNMGLGFFKENPVIIERAIAYLQFHRGIEA